MKPATKYVSGIRTMSYLSKREYLLFNFGRCTVHSVSAERFSLDDLVSFMLYELAFLGCHSQFLWNLHTFASYSYNCKILQPYLSATVRMSSDAVFILHRAPLTKTVINTSNR